MLELDFPTMVMQGGIEPRRSKNQLRRVANMDMPFPVVEYIKVSDSSWLLILSYSNDLSHGVHMDSPTHSPLLKPPI
jgi:hypothetical protein